MDSITQYAYAPSSATAPDPFELQRLQLLDAVEAMLRTNDPNSLVAQITYVVFGIIARPFGYYATRENETDPRSIVLEFANQLLRNALRGTWKNVCEFVKTFTSWWVELDNTFCNRVATISQAHRRSWSEDASKISADVAVA